MIHFKNQENVYTASTEALGENAEWEIKLHKEVKPSKIFSLLMTPVQIVLN